MIPRKLLIRGYSTDTKPIDVIPGTLFFEQDTGKSYIWDGSTWSESGGGALDESTYVSFKYDFGQQYLYWEYDKPIIGTNVSGYVDVFSLWTSNTANDSKTTQLDFLTPSLSDVQKIMSWNHRRQVKVLFMLPVITNQIAYVTVEVPCSGDIVSTSDTACFGIKILNDTIYLITNDGTTENAYQAFTLTGGSYILADMDFQPGIGCSFDLQILDETLTLSQVSQTLTENLPSGDMTFGKSLYMGIKNTADEVKSLEVLSIRYILYLE